MVRSAIVVGGAIVVAASACGSRTSLGDEIGDASVDGARVDASHDASRDGSADGPNACVPAGPDAGACNTLATSGGAITVICDPSPPPMPRGGVVADGTYVLVSSHFHGPCPSPESDRIVWNVCGRAWSTVQESTIFGTTTTQHFDGDGATHGTAFDFRPTCGRPTAATVTFDYDATPTSLTLYVHGFGAGTVRVDTFERR